MTATTPAAAEPRRAGQARLHRKGWTALVFLAPALFLLLVFLVYPALYTVGLSFFRGRLGRFDGFVGIDNYIRLFTDDPLFLDLSTFPPSGALLNNVLWMVVYVSGCLMLGLLVAVLAGRVRYEALIKAIMFMPMAVSATALAVIWTLMYAPNPEIGLLNAVLGRVGVDPVSWLGRTDTVNWALMAVGVWSTVGFTTVVLSAALKGIPTEILEAARTDGAGEAQLFWRILLPMVRLPATVLAVTLVVNVIKLFDLIYVMTLGGPGASSRVIAFTMYQESIPAGRYGYGAAVAVIMLALLIPVIAYNVKRFRTENVSS